MIQIHLDQEHATNYINRIIENTTLKQTVKELQKENAELNQIIDQLQTDLDDLLADEDVNEEETPDPPEEEEELTAKEFLDFIKIKLYENYLKNKLTKE